MNIIKLYKRYYSQWQVAIISLLDSYKTTSCFHAGKQFYVTWWKANPFPSIFISVHVHINYFNLLTWPVFHPVASLTYILSIHIYSLSSILPIFIQLVPIVFLMSLSHLDFHHIWSWCFCLEHKNVLYECHFIFWIHSTVCHNCPTSHSQIIIYIQTHTHRYIYI